MVQSAAEYNLTVSRAVSCFHREQGGERLGNMHALHLQTRAKTKGKLTLWMVSVFR